GSCGTESEGSLLSVVALVLLLVVVGGGVVPLEEGAVEASRDDEGLRNCTFFGDAADAGAGVDDELPKRIGESGFQVWSAGFPGDPNKLLVPFAVDFVPLVLGASSSSSSSSSVSSSLSSSEGFKFAKGLLKDFDEDDELPLSNTLLPSVAGLAVVGGMN